MKSRSAHERHDAAVNLYNLGPNAAVALPTMVAAARAEANADVRSMIARALGTVGAGRDDAIAPLAQLLSHDSEAEVRASAAWSLGSIARQPQISTTALINALKHDQAKEVRISAAEALGATGLAAAAQLSTAALAEALGDATVAPAAARALQSLGPAAAPAVPALRGLMKQADATPRFNGARALAAIGPAAAAALPECLAALADADPELRVEAAIALLAMAREQERAVQTLIEALSFEPSTSRIADRWLRRAVVVRACWALGHYTTMTPARVLPTLAKLASDGDEVVGRFAAQALRAVAMAQASSKERAAFPALTEARAILQRSGAATDFAAIEAIDQVISQATPAATTRSLWLQVTGGLAGIVALLSSVLAVRRVRRRRPRVFLSYRRQDSAAICGRIYDRLADRWGTDHIFRDVDSIAPGQAFADRIAETIRACDVLIAIIGPRWAGVPVDGAVRLGDSADFVHLELAAALAQGKLVIPVLHDGARVPNLTELPTDIVALPSRQAIEISDGHFGADMLRLEQAILGLQRGPRASI